VKQTPVFMTEFALARLLKEFAQRFGLEESMADAMAQVHLQQTETHWKWTGFLMHNCFQCSHAPGSCTFLNPRPGDGGYGVTPEDTRNARAAVIELGKLEECPDRLDPAESRISADQTDTSSDAEGEEDERT
jgi:hypothetical protein